MIIMKLIPTNLERIIVLKTLIITKITYLLISLPKLTTEHINQLHKLNITYIWGLP